MTLQSFPLLSFFDNFFEIWSGIFLMFTAGIFGILNIIFFYRGKLICLKLLELIYIISMLSTLRYTMQKKVFWKTILSTVKLLYNDYPWDPKTAAVVNWWSLFGGHLCTISSKRGYKGWSLYQDRWSLFGSGR